MLLQEEINIIYDPKRNRYRGVYPSLDKWQAIIQSKRICKYLGRFETAALAAECVVQWYKDNYGPLWEKVISRNEMGKSIRVPWDVVSRVKRNSSGNLVSGWKAIVWVNSKPMTITPSILGGEYDSEVWNSDFWTDKAYATHACNVFCDRFRARKVDVHVLFRC